MRKNNLKTVILSFLIFISYLSMNAQNNTSNFWNQVRFGGGIGLNFGDGFFSGTLAPSAIYKFNSQLSLGVGLNGTYHSRKNQYKSTVLGGSVIGLYNPIPGLQASVEFEELNVNRKWDDNLNIADENYWYPALFLGAGYSLNGITIGLRYDVLYDEDKSVYSEALMPFVRVYF